VEYLLYGSCQPDFLNDILFSVYIWHNLCLHLFLSFLDETNDCVFFKCIDAAFVERMYVRGVLDWILFYFFGRTKTLSAVCLYISFHHGCMENNVVLQVTTRSRWQKGTHTKKKHTHKKKVIVIIVPGMRMKKMKDIAGKMS